MNVAEAMEHCIQQNGQGQAEVPGQLDSRTQFQSGCQSQMESPWLEDIGVGSLCLQTSAELPSARFRSYGLGSAGGPVPLVAPSPSVPPPVLSIPPV